VPRRGPRSNAPRWPSSRGGKVHADAQAVFDAVAARVTDHQITGGDIGVVGQKQREAFAAQASDGELTQGSVVAVEFDRLIDVADVFVQAFGDVEMSLAPGACGQGFESACDGGAASTDGDEGDAALVDARQFGIVGELGIEAEPVRIVAGEVMPKFDEAEDFAGLVGTQEIGIGVA